MENIYKETYRKLLTNPSKAFTLIIDSKLDKYEFWRFFLSYASLMSSLYVIAKYCGFSLGFFDVFGIILLIIGVLPQLIFVIGKKLNGVATKPDIINVFSFGLMPLYFSILIQLLFTITFGFNTHPNLDNINVYKYGNVSYNIFLISCYINIALGLLTFIYLMIGISIAQKLSMIKSFFNLILAILIIGIPFVLIRILVGLI